MLVLGDTNSCLAVISAKRNKIPTFHMEAGNRCFDMRVPEEINRKIVDHVSDINLPYSDIARDYLLREGLNPDLVIKTGSPMFEVLSYYKQDIENSEILNVVGLEKNKFFVVSIHREENVEDSENFEAIVRILNELGKRYNLPVIVSTHPRTREKIRSRSIKFHKHVKLCKPFGFADYNKLQISAKAVLSDSGTITEEASILNFPALNLRETHERLEGMDEASVMMIGRNLERTFQALDILENQPRGLDRALFLPSDYNVPNVSEKVLRIIMSYCDYSKRVVWKEH
jgi:UDP-N-acetylglucosamine 2-epimerase (non-hydrolysing)